MYLWQGPIVHALSLQPPYSRHWRSYVVLPQVDPIEERRRRFDRMVKEGWGKPIMVPKTRPAISGTRWFFSDMVREQEAKAMTVHDAEPGDVYVDDGGKLWRCIRPPTVSFEEVEGTAKMDVSGAWVTHKERCEGDIHHAPMWNGWKRIWRKEEPDAAHAKTSPGPVNCQIRLCFQHLTMPKTCERCGLGPCPFFNKDGTRRVT